MEFLQQSLAVLTVFAALAGTVWILRKRGMAQLILTPKGTRRMQVIERLPLTGQHALHLIQIEDKILIVASAPGGCSVLGPLAGKTNGGAR